MDKLPPGTSKVSPENPCDVCAKLAGHYNSQWFVHICSVECFKKFFKRYNKEIDEIALEMKTVSDLKKDAEDEV
ncbi:MAG: hypothetical protein ACTSV7_05430 [Candidatus Baldrarchaeia archaeon]